jgi:hypothetical protein
MMDRRAVMSFLVLRESVISSKDHYRDLFYHISLCQYVLQMSWVMNTAGYLTGLSDFFQGTILPEKQSNPNE